MSQALLEQVFTADEVARAAGVTVRQVNAMLEAGDIRPIPGTVYLALPDAVRAGRRLRATPGAAAAVPGLFAAAAGRPAAERRAGIPAFASSAFHAALVAVAFWLSAGAPTEAIDAAPSEPARLVFIMTPGPGGGGGGGGLRNPLPAPRVQRRGPPRPRVSVPAVTPAPAVTTVRDVEPPKIPTPVAAPEPRPEPPAEPLPSRVLVAPVVAAAAEPREREGVIETARSSDASQGSGIGGGAGTGQGTGNGEGSGAGIGAGEGGGTGGGPYRPGSGISPPRLLREVKAEYTDEGRRRGITGDVLLEIVIRRDGSVGDVSVLRGLGAGLDQRAIAAVRQWRFDPARLRGTPVDVIVEVAVEFTLR
jgi:TonB family protein